MANLSAKEILKYSWRYDLVKSKIKNKDPFELSTGSKVSIVKYDEAEFSAAYKLRSEIRLRNIKFYDAKGNYYTLTKFKKNTEFGGGTSGSGAGIEVTDMSECAVAYFCAAKWSGNPFTSDGLRGSVKKTDCNLTIDSVLSKLTNDWFNSSAIIADKIYAHLKTSSGVSFHKDSAIVKKITKKFKELNDKEKFFSNINKWTPADIWIVNEQKLASFDNDLSKIHTILEFNEYLKNMMTDKILIGVSLKKISNSAKLTYKNYEKDKIPAYRFERLTLGKKNFFDSMDGFIYYHDGNIQFRDFGSWQGEIKGATAAHGKIGGGIIHKILERFIPDATFTTPNETKALYRKFIQGDGSAIEKFYSYYSKMENDPVSISDFSKIVSEKDEKWFRSKMLTTEMMYHIQFGKANKDDIVSSFLGYAASQSELSAPFIKVE